MSIKKNIAKIAGSTPAPNVFDYLFKRPKILFYHGVEVLPLTNKVIQANQMSFDAFAKQIDYLKKKFNIISLDEFYDNLFNHKNLDKNDVIITFDDGYKNNLTVVAPYLNSLNVPFSVFICPEIIQEGGRLPTFYVRAAIFSNQLRYLDLPILGKKFSLISNEEKSYVYEILITYIKTSSNTNVKLIVNQIIDNLSAENKEFFNNFYASEDLMPWSDIRQIVNSNCIIGSHCLDHAILHSNQTHEEINKQLLLSKNIIIEELGKCDYFAFPNGNFNSVCDYSTSVVTDYYKLGLGVDGSSVKNANFNFVSRIGVAEEFNAFKTQVSILSNI